MNIHRGINTTSIARYGLGELPGLLMAVAFVLLFAGIFIPRNWFLGIFIVVEAGAAILYILIDRRNREEVQQLKRELHRINEQPNR